MQEGMQVSGEGGGRSSPVAVRAELVRTLYRQPIWMVAINPFNAAVVGAVLWPSASRGMRAPIIAWVAASLLVALVRALLRQRYLAAERAPAEAPRWARRFTAVVAVAGLLWGAGGAAFYDVHAGVSQLIMVFVIGGMIAGAAGTMAYHLPAFLAYATPALLPLAARIMADGGRLHLGMGVLAIVYGLALVMVAANTNRAVAEAFRLRFENEDLLARLHAAQLSLEDANRLLEQRVAERGAALDRQAEALREARRMESLGLLAGGVAHDFNNLITVMLGNVHLAIETVGMPVEGRVALEEIRGAADRAASLVSQLLAFSRRQVMMRRTLDLNAVVSELQRLLVRLIGEDVDLEVVLQPGPLPILADPVQLEQVVVNLATNARDAMRGTGGKLTIETQAIEVTAERAAPAAAAVPVPATVDPGAWIVLSVRDTGTGMDAETRRLVFHPFFTTKEVGQGTGLGLATVYGIVEQSGGRIFVESALGEGSCFRVFLPRATGAVETGAETTGGGAGGKARPPHRATVLLAEDDARVRAVTVQALSGAGFVVVEAEDGEQALRRAEDHAGPIDLLVTDLIMTRMGGLELARRLKAVRPGLRVLYVSGYAWTAQLPPSDPDAGVDFLRKPFTPEILVDRAARLVADLYDPAADPRAAASGDAVAWHRLRSR
jgi:signal transduction histidine kinase/CheY-like chemotaxis protein